MEEVEGDAAVLLLFDDDNDGSPIAPKCEQRSRNIDARAITFLMSHTIIFNDFEIVFDSNCLPFANLDYLDRRPIQTTQINNAGFYYICISNRIT